MKIADKTPVKVTRTVTLAKETGRFVKGEDDALVKETEKLQLTIHALPLGFEEKVHEWLPFPLPKKKWVVRNGEPVLDPKTKAPLSEEDVSDPVFQAKYKRIVMLQGVAFVHEALKGDSSIIWSTPSPTSDEKAAMESFYASIWKELVDANFTAGDFRALIGEIREISLDKTELFQEIRESFSSEESS